MAPRKGTKVALAKKPGISRSSLYCKPKKPPADEEDKAKIMAVMSEHPAIGAWGSPSPGTTRKPTASCGSSVSNPSSAEASAS